MKKNTKAKKLVPMKTKRAWCVCSRHGKPVYVDVHKRPTAHDVFSDEGETVRRVRIVEDVK